MVLNWNLAANFPPQIASFSPASGSVGTLVGIGGVNLLGATSVSFNGTSASFTVSSNLLITATVPAGATTGPIQVRKPSGTATSSASFTVSPGAANDNFTAAQRLNGNAGTVTGSNAGATKEPGEPNHAGDHGGGSVWYVWTAPANGTWRFDTFGSSFDTVLAVYTGTAVNALTVVASNDDFSGRLTSQVTFNAVAGTTYDIAVDGHGGASGNLVLDWALTADLPSISAFTPGQGGAGTLVTIAGANFTGATAVGFGGANTPTFTVNSDAQISATVPAGAPSGPISVTTSNGTAQSAVNFIVGGNAPSNDNFANAIPIVGASATVTGSNVGATKEAGEPDHGGNPGGSSAWWSWTAPSSGAYVITTRGSGFDTTLGVYVGSSVASLFTMASNDDGPNMGTASLVAFNAAAGTTYRIAVDGYAGAQGDIVLSVYATTLPSDIYYTGFEASEGYSTFFPLAGQYGWMSQGPGQNGVLFNAFGDYGQQAYVGYASSALGNTYAWRPLDYTPDLATRPVVVFSTCLEIVDSTYPEYDDFGWDVYNRNGDRLFFLDFDNNDLGIYYELNDGSGYQYTGHDFQNGYIYYLEVTMDFARKVWSAAMDGNLIVQNAPLSAGNNVTLDLGDIDATWLQDHGTFGNNFMLFDDYVATAAPSLVPRMVTAPQSQTVTVGDNANMRVVVDNVLPLTYQWQFNGANLPAATAPVLTLNNVSFSQAGSYAVVVSNVAGVVTSPPATLTVADLPNLTLYRPAGWSDKIVAATNSSGTLDAGFIDDSEDLYVSWAVVNTATNGNIGSRFYTGLYLDGVLNYTWYTDGLRPGYYTYVTNYLLGKLPAGAHVLRLDTDSTDVVRESNKNDNSYAKSILVSATGSAAPRLVSASRAPNGLFRFMLQGSPQRTYEVQASTNLTTWSVLATLVDTNAGGILQYSDPGSPSFHWRFYRVRLVSP